jgi:hypothetical protein
MVIEQSAIQTALMFFDIMVHGGVNPPLLGRSLRMRAGNIAG